jgi:hypothetical protein
MSSRRLSVGEQAEMFNKKAEETKSSSISSFKVLWDLEKETTEKLTKEVEELKNKISNLEKNLELEKEKNHELSNEIAELTKKNSSIEFAFEMEKKKVIFMKLGVKGLEHRVEKYEKGKKKIFNTEEEKKIVQIQRSFRRKIQTKHFIEILPKFQKSDISKKLKERNQIIREFVKTEESYVLGLSELKKYYIDTLKHSLMDNKVKKKKVTESEMNIIFGNVEHILTIHQVFLVGLRSRLEEWPMTNIGVSLSNQVPLMKNYISYVNGYDDAINQLREIRKNSPDFDKYCHAIKKKTAGNLDIVALLILPVQRLPRYVLLLRELIKNTDENHVDFNNLVSAKRKIEEVTKEINENKRKHEQTQLLNRIQKNLDYVDVGIYSFNK